MGLNNPLFYKMSGSGNDFIIIDNRNQMIKAKGLSDFAKKICCRRMSVGADGLILLEKSDKVDFKWRFFNSDGSLAAMCGNGARCAARFACLHKIAGKNISFETDAGIIFAEIRGELVKIKLTDPTDYRADYQIKLANSLQNISSINTGVPHVIIFCEDLEKIDLNKLGKEIRYHKIFQPEGTNVNYVSRLQDKTFAMRTYERGVEGETLACGTGAVACAIAVAKQFSLQAPIRIITKSGSELIIYFIEERGFFKDVYLEGDARVIYKAELGDNALE